MIMSLSRGSAVQLSAIVSISRTVLEKRLHELQHQTVFEFSSPSDAAELVHVQDLLEFCDDTLIEIDKGMAYSLTVNVSTSNRVSPSDN